MRTAFTSAKYHLPEDQQLLPPLFVFEARIWRLKRLVATEEPGRGKYPANTKNVKRRPASGSDQAK